MTPELFMLSVGGTVFGAIGAVICLALGSEFYTDFLSEWFDNRANKRRLRRINMRQFNEQVEQLTVEELAECVKDGKLDPNQVRWYSEAKQTQMALGFAKMDKPRLEAPKNNIAFDEALAKATEALKVVGTGVLRDRPIVREGCRSYEADPEPNFKSNKLKDITYHDN